jgi:hypothetical protein
MWNLRPPNRIVIYTKGEVHQVDAAVTDSVLIAAGAVAMAILALVITVVIAVRQRKLLKRYSLILKGPVEHDLEQILLDQDQTIQKLQAELAHLQESVRRAAAEAKLHVQKVGTVRFCAFPDMGSDLSFAIALLDANDNGVVFSSLYGRSESRTYAKPILAGKSTYQLSEEEREAIARAIASGKPGASAI